jgi:dTDP-4-amino-4,6-dideoxygalactose transaminase
VITLAFRTDPERVHRLNIIERSCRIVKQNGRKFPDIDPAAAVAAITPRTRAIVPVHLFGQSAELTPPVEAVRRASIPVVEDAAQAIGATYHGRAVGAWARRLFFVRSEQEPGAFGDGRLVTSADDALARRLRLLRNHGMEPKYYHHIVGGNFSLDALQAAVLRVKLPHLASWTAGRRRNAARYRALFDDAGFSGTVRLPVEAPDRTHIYNQFVIRVPDRDALRAHLAHRGIGTEVYDPVPFHLQECFARLGYNAGVFPEAEKAAHAPLALSIYGELTESQQAAVVSAIRSGF